jgi:hypothetical protein
VVGIEEPMRKHQGGHHYEEAINTIQSRPWAKRTFASA